MLILSRADVEALLDPEALIDAVAAAMIDLSAGRVSMPPRVAAMAERAGLLGAMPAYLPSAGILEAKLVSVFPGNAGTGMPTHQAVIAAFDPDTGAPVALMDGTVVTEARTAAASAVATRALALPGAEVLAIVGTGAQARAHAEIVARVRPFRRILVAGRDPARARALAEDLGPRFPGTEPEPLDTVEAAVRAADVVCAATHAREPVVRRAWLRPGTHVNSVGLNPEGREVDASTVADALVVVESRPSALAPAPAGANDLTWAVRDGEVPAAADPAWPVEIGEILSGTRAGRASPDQITLYKSVGVAVQDAAAAALVLAAAARTGAGTRVGL